MYLYNVNIHSFQECGYRPPPPKKKKKTWTFFGGPLDHWVNRHRCLTMISWLPVRTNSNIWSRSPAKYTKGQGGRSRIDLGKGGFLMLRMGREDLPSQFPFVWPCFTFHVGKLSMHWAQLGVCDRMILATRNVKFRNFIIVGSVDSWMIPQGGPRKTNEAK